MTWQIHPIARFADHAAAWDTVQHATTRVPFLESAFIQPLLQEFGSTQALLALHAQGSGHDAAAIVTPAGRGMWQTFQPSQLPLGPWLAPAQDDLAERLKSLLRALPGLGLGLGATQLDPMLQTAPLRSPDIAVLDYVRTSFIDITGTFDTYWESRGKNLRQNTRKQRNKLQTEGLEPTLECLTEPGQVPDALRDYGMLETAGWKAGAGTAIHPDNAQGRFYRCMMENFCAKGRGRIYRYRFGGKVVAMDLCIDNGPVVVILKTAYDESFRAVSPSTLMRFEEFNAWWSEGRYRHIEFYGKTMEWHTRWAEQERQLYHATTYRWPWLRTVVEQVKRRRADKVAAATQPPVEAD
jgi:hypothetical protein